MNITRKFLVLSSCILWLVITAKGQVGQNNVRAAQGNFSQYLVNTMKKNTQGTLSSGAVINSFNNEENTIGKRFLFDTWVKGDSVINAENLYVPTPSFLFNFDQATGNLLASEDKVNIMEVAPAGIRSFILERRGAIYHFEKVTLKDSDQFLIALVSGSGKYALYKKPIAKLVKANFRDDGVVQTGRRDNEYKDESQYYVVEGNTTAQPVAFRPKAIKAAFPLEKEKVDRYFSQHKADIMDENFLSGLVRYLNQP